MSIQLEKEDSESKGFFFRELLTHNFTIIRNSVEMWVFKRMCVSNGNCYHSFSRPVEFDEDDPLPRAEK